MRDTKPDTLRALMQELPPAKGEFLNDVLQSQRITTNLDEGRTQVRRLVKAGAKKVANIQFKGGNFANL